MAKLKTQFVCQQCGQTSSKWLGRCLGCGSWNTLVEEVISSTEAATAKEGSLAALREEFRSGGATPVVTLDSPDPSPGVVGARRWKTGMDELDRVLGSGLMRDSFVLLGGDPGIGKSTLLLQTAKGLVETPQLEGKALRVLYVSGEESVEQIRSRARRLGVRGGDRIFLAAETQLEKVLATVKDLKPDVVILDSLQTFSTSVVESAPGSVGQVREIASRLMTLAKSAGIAVVLVGHVTKEGSIAGPKVVEHLVDTVLYFEGDGGLPYRLLRTVKNRFGSSMELGVFEMDTEGLREVTNPSALFLGERGEPLAGVAVAATLEGSRPLLVELQALSTPTQFSLPRRTSVGIEGTRITLLSAILERHLEVPLSQQDLYFNVAGGLKLNEPAADLGAAAAIWSSARDLPLPKDWVFLGEVGLTGEVRRVAFPELRIAEAKKMGFKVAVVPRANVERLGKLDGIELRPIQRISDLETLEITQRTR